MAKPAKAKAAPVDVAALAQPQAVPTVAPADTFEMLSPEGSIENVRSSQAGTLAALGYKPMTPEIRQSMADQAKYGGTLGEVGASALGFARGASIGLSDYAIKKGEGAGILPQGTTEDVRKLQEFNPDASLVGELASFAVPAAGAIKALGTAGKVAKAAGAAQTGIGLAGDALGAAAGKIAGETFGKYAAPAVKLAAESAIFQAGHNISEESLQNRDLTVESVLAHTGEAAILGAGMGAGLPLAMRAVQAGTEKFLDSKLGQKLISKPIQDAVEFFDSDRSRALFSGGASSSGAPMKKLWADNLEGRKFQGAVKDLGEEGLYARGAVEFDPATAKLVQTAKGPLPGTEEVFERVKATKAAAGEHMGDLLTRTDEMAAARGFASEAAQITSDELTPFIQRIERWKNNSRITEQAAARFEDDTLKMAMNANNKGSNLKAMHEMRMDLDARIGGKNFLQVGSEEIEQVKEMRKLLSQKIEAGMREMGEAGVIPRDTAGNWQRTNKLMSNLYAIEKPLDEARGRMQANTNAFGLRWRDQGSSVIGSMLGGAVGGPVGSGIGALSGYVGKALQTDKGLLMRAEIGEKLATLGWLKKTTDATQTNIAKSMASFVHDIDTDRIARSVVKATAELAADVSNVARRRIEPPKPMAPSSPLQRVASQQEWFDGVSKQLQAIAADPSGFAAKQGAQIGALKANAPETTDAIVAKQMAAYAYLLEAMPKNPTAPMNIMASQWRPADYDIARFRDVVRTVQNPMTVMQDLKAGTLTRAQTQAVQKLYPAIYQQMADQARETVSKPGVNLPYEKRLRLGTLFPGVEASLRPGFIVAMASAPPTKDEQEKMGGYRPGAAAQMKSGSSFQTKTNNLSTR